MIMMAITKQIHMSKRVLEQQNNQHQATWLARSGLEAGVAQLLSEGAKPARQLLEIVPSSKLEWEIESEASGIFRITAQAKYPTDQPKGATRQITARYRRIQEGTHVRVEKVQE
jgi:type II secretory pathway component PulK